MGEQVAQDGVEVEGAEAVVAASDGADDLRLRAQLLDLDPRLATFLFLLVGFLKSKRNMVDYQVVEC